MWQRPFLPHPRDLPFVHGEIDYDREIVLARVLDDQGTSVIRCGLFRFRWDLVPQFVFDANSMSFHPFTQATIQINGQFTKICKSLEVCIRRLRTAEWSILIFAWPLCVPLHRMVDTSWLDGIFCTIYGKAASIIDAQGHLASLSVQDLNGFIQASRMTAERYEEDTDAWNRPEREESVRSEDDRSDSSSHSSTEASPVPDQQRDTTTERQSAAETDDNEDAGFETGPFFSTLRWEDSVWNEEREPPTIAFRDFDLVTRTGRLTTVRDAYNGIYTPIDPVTGEVRLLAVTPEDPADPSRLQLQIESRDVSWGYIAISYCWGDADDQREISVNGCQFSVRRNLY